jgi:hypothetical protein
MNSFSTQTKLSYENILKRIPNRYPVGQLAGGNSIVGRDQHLDWGRGQ